MVLLASAKRHRTTLLALPAQLGKKTQGRCQLSFPKAQQFHASTAQWLPGSIAARLHTAKVSQSAAAPFSGVIPRYIAMTARYAGVSARCHAVIPRYRWMTPRHRAAIPTHRAVTPACRPRAEMCRFADSQPHLDPPAHLSALTYLSTLPWTAMAKPPCSSSSSNGTCSDVLRGCPIGSNTRLFTRLRVTSP